MDWLNYHHLRYFWTVAREGSLQQAAERLRVSPPSISAQIRELEEALDVKLFKRQGRRNVLTEAGQITLRHAEEIFSLGNDLLGTLKQKPTARVSRLRVGVVDSLPKLVSFAVLRPVFSLSNVQLVCSEGKTEDLLRELGAHKLDLVLSDEPASSGVKYRAFNHLLGESTVSLCATEGLARSLRRGFPRSLSGAPFLLPAENTPLRRSLEAWFRAKQIEPRVIAEMDDSALMKVIAAQELGVVPVHDVVLQDASRRFGLRRIGEASGCKDHYYAITAERKITHPVISLLTSNAQKLVFS